MKEEEEGLVPYTVLFSSIGPSWVYLPDRPVVSSNMLQALFLDVAFLLVKARTFSGG